MPYDLTQARSVVRTAFPNAGERTVPDDVLDLALLSGLRRLSSDRPDVKEHQLTSPIASPYALASFPAWEQGFSSIREVIPAPEAGRPYAPVSLDPRRYRTTDTEFFVDISGIRAQALYVKYTVPWTVKDLGGAAATSLPASLEAAHMWISCRFLALSLAAKMAGTTDRQVPSDFINFRTRSDEYRALAKEFEENYRAELGLTGKSPAPVILTSPATSTPPVTWRLYTTHRSVADWD